MRKIPFAELLGITFLTVEPGKVVATMRVRDELCTAGGTIHGGALMAFADTVGAAVTFANLPNESAGTTTLESKTNFLRGAPAGSILTATGIPIHLGRRTHVHQTRIEGEDGKAVAIVTQTQMIL